jgi:hypothetical protein
MVLVGSPVAAGVMLRCQFGLDDGNGCGPSLIVSRVDL